VVISIIALLIGILLPALSAARGSARTTQCLSNVRGMAQTYAAYEADHQHNIYYKTEMWVPALNKYGFQRKARLCPDAKQLRPGTAMASGGYSAGSATAAWKEGRPWDIPNKYQDLKKQGYVMASYGMNGWAYSPDPSQQPTPWFGNQRPLNHGDYVYNNVFSAPDASNIPLFGDAIWRNGWPMYDDAPPANNTRDPDPTATGSSQMARWCVARHGGNYINLVFADGHAKTVALKHLWKYPWHRDWLNHGQLPEKDNVPMPSPSG